MVDGVLIPRSRLSLSLKPCEIKIMPRMHEIAKKCLTFQEEVIPVAKCCLQSQPHCCIMQAWKGEKKQIEDIHMIKMLPEHFTQVIVT